MGEVVHEVKMSKGWWLSSTWVMALGFVGMGAFIPDQPLFFDLMLYGFAVLLILIMPDIRAVYGTEGIKLTFGLKGMYRVRIPKDEVTYISIAEFNPMRDFGGWGIKGGRGQFRGVLMWAMPATKNRGVLIETIKGKKYLIGDVDPENTLTILGSFYPVDPGSVAH